MAKGCANVAERLCPGKPRLCRDNREDGTGTAAHCPDNSGEGKTRGYCQRRSEAVRAGGVNRRTILYIGTYRNITPP